MKHLPLIILLCFVSCGKKHKSKKDNVQGIPYVLITENDVNDFVGAVSAGSTNGQSTNGSQGGGATSGSAQGGAAGGTTGSEPTGEERDGVTTGGTNGSETTGGTDGSETTGTTNGGSLVDAKVVSCLFSNTNEQQTLSMNISEQDGNKYAELSADDGGKVEFDGYVFSPSANENASVQSVDKKLKVDGKEVQKITARIVFNAETGEGELQLSYRLKGKKGLEEETSYSTLAEINHCSAIE